VKKARLVMQMASANRIHQNHVRMARFLIKIIPASPFVNGILPYPITIQPVNHPQIKKLPSAMFHQEILEMHILFQFQ
jgi:hypothetical protein